MEKYLTLLAAVLLMTSCRQDPGYDATGTFEAQTVTLSAEVQGRVLSFDVEEGGFLSAGDPVCRIDSTTLVLQRQTLQQQQRALLAGKPDIQKQLSSQKEQITRQQREVTRLEALVADEAVPRKQLDDASAQLSVLQCQYEATLSSLSKNASSVEENAAVIAAQIDQIDHSIACCRPFSPTGGVVLAQYVRPGELVTPGKPLLKIGDTQQMYLRAYFTSDQLPRISVGQQVNVWADFGGGQRYAYPGVITWIASESEFTPKNIQTSNSRANLVYAAKIAVVNDGRLKIGVYGEVTL